MILIGTILDFLKKRDRKYKKDIEIQKTEVIKDINDFIKKTDEQNRKNKILKDLELI